MSNRNNLFLQDSDQVLIIFSKVFGIVALSTLTLQLMRSGDRSETWDKLIFATAIVVGIAGFVSIFLLKTKSFRLDLITLIAAFAGILLGVGGIEEHDPINTVEKPVSVDGESDAVAHFQRGEGRDMASVHGAYGVAWGIAVL